MSVSFTFSRPFLWLSDTIEFDFLQTKYISLEHFSFCLRTLSFFFFFWLHWITCGILLPQQGIEAPLEAQSLNHWTTRGVPELSTPLKFFFLLPSMTLLLALASKATFTWMQLQVSHLPLLSSACQLGGRDV